MVGAAAQSTRASSAAGDDAVSTSGDRSAAPTAAGAPGALPAPSAVPTGPSALTAPPAASTSQSPAPAPAPLGQQLVRPLFSLASAGHGTHTVTVTVAPEALGPVTVRAHVSATGMQVEMFAGSDAARDAVRAIIPDLRRDMGGAGLQVGIDLSSQNQPSDPRGQSAAQNALQNGTGTGTGADRGDDPSGAPGSSRAPLDPGADGPQLATDPTRASLTTTSLDVLA